jgi:hypothetical protein
MPNDGSISAGKLPDIHYLMELKIWLERARDMLIPAIQRAENELEQILQIESALSEVEALSPVLKRVAKIRAGMEACLDSLRHQDREWIKRINSVENLGRISVVWKSSSEVSDMRCLIELKAWLEDARDMLIRVINGAEEELERIRRIESALSEVEALPPVLKRIAKIRAGMEESLVILWDQNVEWVSRIPWVENLGRFSAAPEASRHVGVLEGKGENVLSGEEIKALLTGEIN